jgi:DNA-binding winged helix-turn-helix (wHTH) protein
MGRPGKTMDTVFESRGIAEKPNVVNAMGKFPARCVRFDLFQLDLQRQELFKSGTQIRVQGKVFQALLVLLSNPGEIVTREELRNCLWPHDTHVNYDANVNTTVNKLRQVLGDTTGEPKFIETVPRRGYSFIAKVEHVDEPVKEIRSRTGTLDGARPAEQKSTTWSWTPAGVRGNVWFTAGVIALVVAAMLFGAAMTLYSYRAW